MNLKTVKAFHHTRTGYSIFCLLELSLSYLLASLAINSGSLWQWFLALGFLLGGFINLIQLARNLIDGERQTN